MAICPFCKEEISYLIVERIKTRTLCEILFIGHKTKKPQYKKIKNISPIYVCPNCKTGIAISEPSAIGFLRGVD